MKPGAAFALVFACAAVSWAQDETPSPAPTPVAEESPAAASDSTPSTEASRPPAAESTPYPSSTPTASPSVATSLGPVAAPSPAKRGWFGRILHPFGGGSSEAPPQYSNPKLRGLIVDVQVSPQPVQLSEVRQLEVKVTLTNKGKRGVNLDFPNEQRIEIYLMTSAEVVLTRWSETHAFKDKSGTLLINPQEHVEYSEKISTRELTPDKVFICEAFLPKYPELRGRQKFLTAP